MIVNLPPRNELWAAVQEAHDYLYQYLNDPTSREHPDLGTIEFNSSEWGTQGDNICWVCLGGLYYLRKEGTLLPADDDTWNLPVPPMLQFLNNLRYPDEYCEDIEEWLGVTVISDQDLLNLVGGQWDSTDPKHILAFLGWLLERGKLEGVYEPTLPATN